MSRRTPLSPPIEAPTGTPPVVEAATPLIPPADRIVAAWWTAQARDLGKARAILGDATAPTDPLDQQILPALSALLGGDGAPDALMRERGNQCPAFLEWGPGPRPLSP